jgi:hypothetical protein
MYLSTLVWPRFPRVPFLAFIVGPRLLYLQRILRLLFHSLGIKALHPSDFFHSQNFCTPPYSYHNLHNSQCLVSSVKSRFGVDHTDAELFIVQTSA